MFATDLCTSLATDSPILSSTYAARHGSDDVRLVLPTQPRVFFGSFTQGVLSSFLAVDERRCIWQGLPWAHSQLYRWQGRMSAIVPM